MNFRRQLRRKIFNAVPAYNHGLYKLCVRYVDRFNGENNSNPEENGEYLFLRKELPIIKDGIVFDVGANVGDWASFVLSINPNVNLHCFEPSKATYRKLTKKKWPLNVQLNYLGLGEFEGKMELNVVNIESGMNSIYKRRGVESAKVTNTEQIHIATIDNYCEKNGISHIDLLKVDVEGHELAVFKGMSRMLMNGLIRTIQFEYGGCNLDAKVSLGDILYFLEPYSFNFYKLYPDGSRHVEKYKQSLDSFKYSNWLAIHKDC